MAIYITSDYHSFHENIIKYCSRPFSSAIHMNEVLAKNTNNIVRADDTLYHLGDWAFGGITHAESFRDMINCRNVYNITGNHDHYHTEEDQKKFDRLFVENITYKEINAYSKKIVLCHYAMRVWNKSHRGSWQLWGHSHAELSDDPTSLSIDVGVDTGWEGIHEKYRPYSMDEINEIMTKRKKWISPNFTVKWQSNPEKWWEFLMSVPSVITVRVTKNDLNRGVPEDADSCAISCAVARQRHKSLDNLHVHTNGDEVHINGRTYVGATKRDVLKMQNFIRNFDDDYRRRYCRPTTIRLRLED